MGTYANGLFHWAYSCATLSGMEPAAVETSPSPAVPGEAHTPEATEKPAAEAVATGNWRTLKSPSLEDFVMWLIRVLVLVAFLVLTYRYAFSADPHAPPWESLPILDRL